VKAADREEDFLKLWGLFGFPANQPERQWKFNPDRRWKFDFCWPSHMVAVEIEGGTFGRFSRHTSSTGHHNDCDKYNSAAVLGWYVLRFSAKHLTSDPQGTIDRVVRMLERQA